MIIMHLNKRLTCFINASLCDFKLLKSNLHLVYDILFKSLLFKICLKSAIARFLSYNMNKIYNYKIKVTRRFS